jgi:hypothetical protein
MPTVVSSHFVGAGATRQIESDLGKSRRTTAVQGAKDIHSDGRQ